MNKNEKVEMVSQVKELIQNSSAVYLTDYAGVSVEEITKLRNEFRKEGVKYKVLKNTLAKRAFHEIGGFERLDDYLVGMTGFAFADENPVAPAKVIKKFFDDKKKFPLKACYIDTQFYDGSNLSELASLPSKPEVIAGILGSINAPVSGIVGAINAVIRDLVSVVDEISKKQAA